MHKEMESSVFFSIFQLMQFMKYQGMKRMEELDIKPSQAGILFSLKCWGEQSQRQLAQRVGITPPSMTVALRKMEEKGYVSRKTDEKDQRITRIQLAPKGGRMYRWNTPCPYRDGRNNLSGDIKRRGTSDEASACRDEE